MSPLTVERPMPVLDPVPATDVDSRPYSITGPAPGGRAPPRRKAMPAKLPVPAQWPVAADRGWECVRSAESKVPMPVAKLSKAASRPLPACRTASTSARGRRDRRRAGSAGRLPARAPAVPRRAEPARAGSAGSACSACRMVWRVVGMVVRFKRHDFRSWPRADLPAWADAPLSAPTRRTFRPVDRLLRSFRWISSALRQ